MSPRRLAPVYKRGYKKAWEKWLKEVFPKKFEPSAYGKYPDAYNDTKKWRKKRGKPMVRTGKLKKTMMKKSSSQIKGTSKGASITIKTGRPFPITDEQLSIRSKFLAETLGITERAARAKIMSRRGYGRERQKQFQENIEKFNKDDLEFFANVVKDEIMEHFEKLTKKKSKRVLK